MQTVWAHFAPGKHPRCLTNPARDNTVCTKGRFKLKIAGERRPVLHRSAPNDLGRKARHWQKVHNPQGSAQIPIQVCQHTKRIESLPTAVACSFDLPETALPCSFESRVGQIRYFFKVIIDIPYASPPQGMKYFTIIGPHVDCMDEHYLVSKQEKATHPFPLVLPQKPIVLENRRSTCCWCCKRGTVSLKSVLERSAYVCKESIKLKVTIDNQGEEDVWLRIRYGKYPSLPKVGLLTAR